jgi:hypothetical protein
MYMGILFSKLLSQTKVNYNNNDDQIGNLVVLSLPLPHIWGKNVQVV